MALERKIRIRRAAEGDVAAMAEIFNYEVRNSTASFAIQEKTYEERLAWYCAHQGENHPLIVAEEDGQVAGYACLSEYRPHEAYKRTVELSVYVSPDFRRRGVGRALMEEILRMARENNGVHTVISVITADNEASIRLHEAMGFSFCGTMHQVGEKFGRMLDIVNYELLV